MTMSVQDQERHQSRYIIPAHGPARIETSMDPEWIALQERRAAMRQRGMTAEDAAKIALVRVQGRTKRWNGKKKEGQV